MAGDLRAELEKIRKTHGRLTPPVVVAEARDPDHPLHSRFEWDDAVAGEQYRLVQAGELIRSVKVRYRKGNGDIGRTNQYVSVRDLSGEPPERDYRPVEEVAQDEVATRIVLADMRREWQALRDRYQAFDEFRQMILADLSAA